MGSCNGAISKNQAVVAPENRMKERPRSDTNGPKDVSRSVQDLIRARQHAQKLGSPANKNTDAVNKAEMDQKSKHSRILADINHQSRDSQILSYVAMHPNGIQCNVPQLAPVSNSSIAQRRGSLSLKKLAIISLKKVPRQSTSPKIQKRSYSKTKKKHL